MCNSIHLGYHMFPFCYFYTLGGEVICPVSEIKYLGVILSDDHGKSQLKTHMNSCPQVFSETKLPLQELEGFSLTAEAVNLYNWS